MKVGKILVAVDGSPNSDMALSYAIGLAKDLGSGINVIHVLPKEKTEAESTVLKAAVESVKDARIPNVGEVLAHGDPGDLIVKTAEKSKADLIIMGSRGLSQVRSLLLGSVSYKVVQSSTVPVLIVKKGV